MPRALLFLTQILVAGALSTAIAAAQNLVVYCSMPEEWCRVMVDGFTRETGAQTSMIRFSSGETYARIKAEVGRPRADVWWGGTSDPHLQAAEEGLTEPYRSPMLDELHPWATALAEASGNRTVGVAAGVLGIIYNSELVARKGLPAPRCWSDLLKPEWKGEIQTSNPNSSGTGYNALATLVQLLGEDRGFEYLRALDRNVNQYTKSGDAPAEAAARGETTVAIAFLQAGMARIKAGFPLKLVAPCEGTGYEVPAMSIVRGGPNPELARRFFDWALTARAQELAVLADQLHTPANRNAAIPPGALDPKGVKLVDFDFRKFGDSATRRRLLARWDAEVGARR